VTCATPLIGKLFVRPLGFPKSRPCTKFEVPSSCSFEDIFDCMPKILGSRDLSHGPFVENYLCARSAFPRQSHLPNLNSVSQVLLKICSTVCQKFEGSSDLGNAAFKENLFARSYSLRRSFIPNLKSLAHVLLKIYRLHAKNFRVT